MRLRDNYIFWLCFIVVLGTIIGIQKQKGNNMQLNETELEFINQIKDIGPESAYKDFKSKYNSNLQRHFLVHIFGEALFNTVGPDGVAICDDSFEFGCYHGFFSAGLSDGNFELIYSFNESCHKYWLDKSSPCQHGIGHGLFSNGLSLNESLEWCQKIMDHPTGGCLSGVFMENNFPTNAEHTDTSPRELRGEDFYSPCPGLKTEFQTSCFFELPQWWLRLYEKDFERVASMCNAIPNKDNREWCFYGAGQYAVPSLDYDVYKTAEVCDSFVYKSAAEWCRIGASWIFVARPDADSTLPIICSTSKDCWDKVKQNPFYEKI